MAARYTIERILNICAKAKVEFLDANFINSDYKHRFKCLKCGFIRNNKIARIIEGRKCFRCLNHKYTLETAKELWRNANLEYLDNIYLNNFTKVNTKCKKCNHLWLTTLNNVQSKANCPKCGGTLKKTLNEAIELWNKNNLDYLDNVYINNETPMNTKCKKCSYIWKINFGNVRNGKNCPKCAGVAKYTLQEAINLFEKSNLILLDQQYFDVKTKYNVKCKNCNADFKITLDTVLSGQKCSKCTSHLKTEKIALSIIENFFNLKTHKKIIKMNCDFQKTCTVDAAFILNEKEYFIEINGKQHYAPVRFGGVSKERATKQFEKQIKRDEWLKKYCSDNNILFIEVDTSTCSYNNLKDYIFKILANK